MMRPPAVRMLLPLVALAAVSCLEDPLEATRDASRDTATTDLAAADLPTDRPAAQDAPDATVDASLDVAADTAVDAVAVDRSSGDVTPDAPVDVPRDAGDAGFFGSSRCADAGLALCEDFEADAGFDHTLWSSFASNGTLVVDTVRAARGTHALHIHTHAPAVDGGAGANVGLRAVRGFPPPGDTYFGRAFVWMAVNSPTTHATLFESGGTLDGGVSVSQRFSVSSQHIEASYDTSPRPPTTDYSRRSAMAMPLDRWACVEWQFKGDTNELHFWVDGVELADTAVLGSRVPAWIAPAWTRVNLGLQLYRPDIVSDFDLWLDEVAIDTARIGCFR